MLSHVSEHVFAYVGLLPDGSLLGHYRLVDWSWPSLHRVVVPVAGAGPSVADPTVGMRERKLTLDETTLEQDRGTRRQHLLQT